MARYLMVFTVLLASVHPAMASLSPRKDTLPFEKGVPRAERRMQWARALPPREPDYRITAGTEVRLNGRRCKYEQIPPGAVIHSLEVDEDGETVLRVEFRTGK